MSGSPGILAVDSSSTCDSRYLPRIQIAELWSAPPENPLCSHLLQFLQKFQIKFCLSFFIHAAKLLQISQQRGLTSTISPIRMPFFPSTTDTLLFLENSGIRIPSQFCSSVPRHSPTLPTQGPAGRETQQVKTHCLPTGSLHHRTALSRRSTMWATHVL